MRFRAVSLVTFRLDDMPEMSRFEASAGWSLERDGAGGVVMAHDDLGNFYLPPGAGWIGHGAYESGGNSETHALALRLSKEGATHKEIAKELGLSRQRVGQLLKEVE